VLADEYGDELLGRLLSNLTDVVPGVIGAGLCLARGSRVESVAVHGVAAVLDPLQVQADDGPLIEAVRSSGALVADLSATRWPRLAKAVLAATDGGDPDVASSAAAVVDVVCVPGAWGDVDPVLLSAYLDRPATPELLADLDRHEALMSQALAVVRFCAGESLRADQMLAMAQSRRIIEQAKGLVMAARRCDAEAAFAVLTRASQHLNVRIQALSVALVEHVGRAPAEAVPDLLPIDPASQAELALAERIWAAVTADDAS
jgi:hypothetical protein